MSVYLSATRRQYSGEVATNNAQPLSDIINTPSLTTYEQLDDIIVGPANSRPLPTETRQEDDHYDVVDSSNVNTFADYEELNSNTRLQQVPTTQTGQEHGYYNVNPPNTYMQLYASNDSIPQETQQV